MSARSRKNQSKPKVTQRELKELKFAVWDDFEHLGHILRDDICGKVFEAVHRKTGNYCAIHQRAKPVSAGQQDALYEARLLISLNNSNFITAELYCMKKEERIEYIVFESEPVGTFGDFLIAQPGCKGEKFAKFYTAQVAHALEFLHDRDIAHRNISPHSLLLYEDGYLKLTSFNYAVILGGQRHPFPFEGDPQYMAPEIYEQEAFGKSVDVWALGMLAYRLAFGTTLYEDCKTPEEVHKAIEKRHANLFDPPKLAQKPLPQTWTFVASVLTKQIPMRLGIRNDGMATLKQDSWFWSTYDVEKIKAKETDPPICPCIRTRCRKCASPRDKPSTAGCSEKKSTQV